jgi:hypothetical protein
MEGNKFFDESETVFIGGGYFISKLKEYSDWIVEYGSMTLNENPFRRPRYKDVLFVELALCIDTLKFLKLLEKEPIPLGMNTNMECTRWALHNFAEFGLKGKVIEENYFLWADDDNGPLPKCETIIYEVRDCLKTFKEKVIDETIYLKSFCSLEFEFEIDLAKDRDFDYRGAQQKIKIRINRIISIIKARKSMKDFRNMYKLFCENNNNE